MTAGADRRRFRPGLVPSLLAVPTLIILLVLGTWQLQRLAWKTDLIDRIEGQVEAAPVPLPASINTMAAWDFRRVSVTGTYDTSVGQLNLLGRTSDRGRAGQHVLGLLTLTQGEAAGQQIIVDRGWVPAAFEDAMALDSAGLPMGVVTLTGVLRAPRPPGWMQPANDPASNSWFTLDPVMMGQALGAEPSRLVPMVLERGGRPDQSAEAYPRGGRTRIDLPNNHLHYAITWYSLAATLAVIFVLSQRRRDPPA